MATTIDTYLPFDSGAGANVTETGWRDMMKHMLGSASGVIFGFDNNFSTVGDSSGMQVKTSSGQCFMRGHYGRNASTRTLAIATAHATLARKDAAIIRADFVNNRIELDVLTGTAAASPVLPTLTQNTSVWETLLAEVNVAAAVGTISAAAVVDRRVYTTGFAKYLRTTTLSVPSVVFTTIAYNSVVNATGDVSANTAGDQFTLLRSGLWCVTAMCGIAPSTVATAGQSLQIQDGSGTPIYAEGTDVGSSTTVANFMGCTATERFTNGDTIRTQVWQNQGTSRNTVASKATITFLWIGP